MEKEEKIVKNIIKVYTTIMKKAVDKNFAFPEGGRVKVKLSQFISKLNKEYGDVTAQRLVDYCVFQIHKNRSSKYQSSLAVNSFGDTGFSKYKEMANKRKNYAEDAWLSENELSRVELQSLIEINKEHPQAKYIYMESEEPMKKRFLGTLTGFFICCEGTLLWSPFSKCCNECALSDKCKIETAKRYPEIYRLRVEKYEEYQR